MEKRLSDLNVVVVVLTFRARDLVANQMKRTSPPPDLLREAA